MKKWESIAAATDFSEASRPAIREAARLANWHRCPLHVAHVISVEKDNPNSRSNTAISIVRDQVDQYIRYFTTDEIDVIPELEYHIMVGHSFRELCQLTEDIHADLLIMGSYGSGNKPERTGVIATKCVRKAPVPVLLIRENHEGPFQDILVAIDFSNTSKRLIEAAAEIAFENQSTLHFVHVYKPVLNISDYAFCDLNSYMDSTEYKMQSMKIREQLDTFRKETSEQYSNLEIKDSLIHGNNPADAICEYIHQHNIDLAVLGTRGRNGIKSLLLGTTAERLIQECPCSVLAIKPEGFSYKL